MIDKIRLIKYLRLKPEQKYLLDILNNLKLSRDNKYPHSIFFNNNDIMLFQWDYKTGYFWCNYNDIWHKLEVKYDLGYFEVKYLIKNIINDFLLNNNIKLNDMSETIKQLYTKEVEPLILTIPDKNPIKYNFKK